MLRLCIILFEKKFPKNVKYIEVRRMSYRRNFQRPIQKFTERPTEKCIVLALHGKIEDQKSNLHIKMDYGQ